MQSYMLIIRKYLIHGINSSRITEKYSNIEQQSLRFQFGSICSQIRISNNDLMDGMYSNEWGFSSDYIHDYRNSLESCSVWAVLKLQLVKTVSHALRPRRKPQTLKRNLLLIHTDKFAESILVRYAITLMAGVGPRGGDPQGPSVGQRNWMFGYSFQL